MTTPASNSAYAIICDAYVDAGKLGLGVTPSGEQIAQGLRRLRDIINFLQIRGLKVFQWEDITLPLVAGTATYTFAPGGSVDMTKPLRVLQAFYLYDTSEVRRPLTVLSMNEYYLLGQAGTATSNRGTVTQYYIEKLVSQLRATLWLCPDTEEAANGDVHFIMQTQITNPTELDETVLFPQEWRIGLRWSLAYDLSTGQPDSVIERCRLNAEKYIDALENWDVEDAPVQFQVDSRLSQYAGKFK